MDEEALNQEIEQLRADLNLHKIDRISKYSRIGGLSILVILFAFFVYGSVRLNTLYKDVELIESKKQAETLKYNTLLFENNALETKKQQLEKELMTTYGLTVDNIKSISGNQVLEKSISANDAIKTLLQQFTPGQNVTVRYYSKTIDEKRVVIELQALGYNFEEKSAAEYMSKRGTNAMWFGSGVGINDVKIAALALIRAGVPIKGIRPFKNNAANPAYKKNIIEVGASVDLDQKPPLTVQDVLSAKAFTR